METYPREPLLTPETYIRMIELSMTDTPCKAITISIPRPYVETVLSSYKSTHRFMIDQAKNPRNLRVTIYTNVQIDTK